MTDTQRTALHDEDEDVQALLRAIALNRSYQMMGRNPPSNDASLTYNMGALSKNAEILNADAVLFVFVRDSYATAGRKSLLAISVIGAALTGIAIVPQMGSTLSSAALVERDGTVIWFNYMGGMSDLRTPDGVQDFAKQILVGLPRAKSSSTPPLQSAAR